MRQVVINTSPISNPIVNVTWELGLSESMNEVIYKLEHSSEYKEVFNIPAEYDNIETLYCRATAYYDDGTGTLVPEVLGVTYVVSPRTNIYANDRKSDPVLAPIILVQENTDTRIVFEVEKFETMYNLAELKYAFWVLTDNEGEIIGTYKTENSGTLTIDKDEDLRWIFTETVTIVCQVVSTLNEGSRFGSLTLLPDSSAITLLRQSSALIDPTVDNTIEYTTNGRTVTEIYIVDPEDEENIVYELPSPNPLLIPKYTLMRNKIYTIVFGLDDGVYIYKKIKTLANTERRGYIGRKYKYELSGVNNIPSNGVPFRVDIFDTEAVIKMEYMPVIESDTDVTAVVNELNNRNSTLENIVDLTTTEIITRLDELENLVTDYLAYVTPFKYRTNSFISVHGKLWDIHFKFVEKTNSTLYSNETITDVKTQIMNIGNILLNVYMIVLKQQPHLTVSKFHTPSEHLSYVPMDYDPNTPYRIIELSRDTILQDYYLNGTRHFSIMKIDTISFVNHLLYTVDIGQPMITRNASDITFVPEQNKVVFVKDIDGNDSEIWTFDIFTYELVKLPDVPANPDGTVDSVSKVSIGYIGNSKIGLAGGVFTDANAYRKSVFYVYDLVTEQWDNTTNIPTELGGNTLVFVDLLNGSTALISDTFTTQVAIVKDDTAQLVDMGGTIVPHRLDGIYIGHNNVYLETDEGLLQFI